MTKWLLLLAALGGGLAGQSAADAGTTADPALAQRPAVLVQAPADACSSPSAPGTSGGVLADARARAPRGAPVTLVCGPADAQVAVLRALAMGHDLVLGDGPAVRAAQALAAADHPEAAFAALPR